jgi:hypothetical protein
MMTSSFGVHRHEIYNFYSRFFDSNDGMALEWVVTVRLPFVLSVSKTPKANTTKAWASCNLDEKSVDQSSPREIGLLLLIGFPYSFSNLKNSRLSIAIVEKPFRLCYNISTPLKGRLRSLRQSIRATPPQHSWWLAILWQQSTMNHPSLHIHTW